MKCHGLTLILMAALAGGPHPSQAQDLMDRKISLEIASQPLPDALNELARQTGVQVMVYSQTGAGLVSARLSGSFTPRDAVAKLLAGTGLAFELRANDVIVVKKAAADPGASRTTSLEASDPVHLAQAAQPPGTPSGASAPQPAAAGADVLEEVVVSVFGRGVAEAEREIPQSIDVFPAEFISNVDAHILDDVVRFVPNATTYRWSPPFNSIITIRGFDTTQAWNGLGFRYESSPPSMANVERIEVLKGPASVLYGSMEPGAVLNIVTKRPQSQFAAEASLRYGSYNDTTATVDVGGPLTERVRARFNASYNTTDTLYEHSGLRDLFLAPTVELDLGERTLLTVEGYYDKRSFPGGFIDGNLPRSTVAGLGDTSPFGTLPISTRLNWDKDIAGPPGYGNLHLRTENIDASARLAHRFNDDWALNVALAWHGSDRDEESLFLNSDPGILDPDGRTAQRWYWAIPGGPEANVVAHADVSGEFATGALSHKLIVGLDYARDRYLRRLAYFQVSSIDVFDPVYGTIELPDPMPLDVDSSQTTEKGIFVQDRMSYGRLHLLAGGRLAYFHSNETYRGFGEEDPEYDRLVDNGVWTPQLGVLYDIGEHAGVHASRSDSFVPQSAIVNGRETVKPEKSVQYEAGTKIGLGHGRVNLNFAVFHIEKNDIFITDPTNGFNSIPVGQVISKGFELSIDGHPAPGVTLYAGYGYNKTRITHSDDYQGLPFAEVPEQTIALVGRYDVQAGALHGLGITGSLNFKSEVWSSDYFHEVPSWTQVDVGLVYPVSRRIELRFNVANLLDQGLYDVYDVAGDILYRGERTYFAEATLRF